MRLAAAPVLLPGIQVLLALLLALALVLLSLLVLRLLSLRARLRQAQREHDRLVAAQKLAGIGYCEYAIAQHWLVASDAALQMHGITREDFDGRFETLLASVHGEDRPRVQALREESLASGTPLQLRYRVVHADGSVRTLDEYGQVQLRGEGDGVLRSTLRDVSALVAAGEREREQAEQYRYLFASNPVPLAVYHRESLAILAVNTAAAQMLGRTREALLQLHAEDVLGEPDRGRIREHLARVGPEQIDAGIFVMQRADDQTLLCRVYGQDIAFDGQRARLVMLLDVTAAERARQELEASEMRLRLAARASHDAIWDYDVVAETLWWNEGYATLFGHAAGDSAPRLRDWLDRVHPDDRERVETSFTAALAGRSGEQWQEDYRYRHADGYWLDVRDRGYLLRDAQGTITRMIGGMHDRSGEVNARRDLERRERNYRLLVQQLPAPLLVLQDGRVRLVNAAASALLRAPDTDSALGVAVEALFAPDAAALCRQPQTQGQSLETTLRALDGTHAEVQLILADFSGSEVGGVQVLLRDLGAERRRAAEAEERVAFFRLSSDGFGILDAQMHLQQANDALRRMLDIERGSQLRLTDVFDVEHCERVLALRESLRAGQASDVIECRIVRGDEERWLELGFVHARSDAWYMVARDITRQMRAEAESRLLQRAVEAVENGVLIADARKGDLPLVYVNPAFTRITGYSALFALGRAADFLYGNDADQPGLHALREAMAHGQSANVLLRNYRTDGTLFWNRLRMAPVYDERGLSHWVGIQQDISEEVRSADRLRQQALTDELTGLANRRALREAIEANLAHEPLALVHLGLDQFKLINDALGHASGDALLQTLGQRLRASLPEVVLLARSGGDEFQMLVPRATVDLPRALERIGATLRQPLELAGVQQSVHASIGVALAPEHGDSAEALLRVADAALHEAKRRGRNRTQQFDAHLHEEAGRRLTVLSRLRGGDLDRELALHYQTIHAGSDGAVTGAEVLLRWPEGPPALRTPDVLVPLLEESGLILPVGRWVLEQACRAQAALRAHLGAQCKVALNVSTQQLMFGDFVAEVRSALAGSGADPRLIELEITESALMADPAKAEAILQQLKQIGVSIAIDDFGTGYSSLGYLHRLSADKLKIDRSFVRDVLTDADDATICASIIQLAHGLGLQVVAEGVETEAQRQWLAARGCEQMQGWLFARAQPLPPAPAIAAAT